MTCDYCGSRFTARLGTLYCSNRCRHLAQRHMRLAGERLVRAMLNELPAADGDVLIERLVHQKDSTLIQSLAHRLVAQSA